MPRGASSKREREYQKLERRFKAEHRYPGREEEVASRIVNKQRQEYGETQEAQQKDHSGKSPDRNLPLANYDGMTIARVTAQLDRLTATQVRKIRMYELAHKHRKGLLTRLERYLSRH